MLQSLRNKLFVDTVLLPLSFRETTPQPDHQLSFCLIFGFGSHSSTEGELLALFKGAPRKYRTTPCVSSATPHG
jgi:hypothetical protein